MRTYISFGDFLDVFNKVKEKGIRFLFSKIKILDDDRIEAKWDNFESNSDFWIIPEVYGKWNEIISGNASIFYEDYVFEKYLKTKTSISLLSIGCGEGLHERNFAKYNSFTSIDAIDFSSESIRIAKQKATESNFEINYLQGDFKQNSFKQNHYDVVLFSSSLHHFENVDSLLSEYVKPLMKDSGILVIFEYCGPNKLQFSSLQLEKANKLLQSLPKKYKQYFHKKGYKRKCYRPGLLRMKLVDPSEAIDSESIIPSLNKHFKKLEEKKLGWNILHILLKNIAHNFLNNDLETKDLLNKLISDELKFTEETNTTDAVFGVYAKP